MNDFDFSEFDDWVNKLQEADKWQDARRALCKDLANRLVTLAKKRTPVDTGELRRGFSTKNYKLTETSDGIEVEIINPIEYASYVEYGHRTKGGKSYISPVFMLTNAELALCKNAPKYVEKKLMQFMEGLL